MRYLRPLALLAALALASPGAADPISLVGSPKTFTDCASGGSAAQTLLVGGQLLRVVGETVWLCFAASGSTCASGGEAFPAGTVMYLSITSNQVSVSCRSASSTGDAYLTPAS